MTPRDHAANAVANFHALHAWAYDPMQHAELDMAIAREMAIMRSEAVEAERERILAAIDVYRSILHSPVALSTVDAVKVLIGGDKC